MRRLDLIAHADGAAVLVQEGGGKAKAACAPPQSAAPGEYYAAALEGLLRGSPPFRLHLPEGRLWEEVGGRLAARLECALVPNAILPDDMPASETVFARMIPGGTERVRVLTPSMILTARPSQSIPSPSAVSCTAEDFVSLARVLGRQGRAVPGAGPRLSEARIVVAGGAGMGPDGFDLLRALGVKLGAALGASRSAVSLGFAEPEMQVGLSGKVVAPDIYIACAISGSMQHQAGMSGARTVVAINRDASAPIFRIADLGIVGDVKRVIPALIERLKEQASDNG